MYQLDLDHFGRGKKPKHTLPHTQKIEKEKKSKKGYKSILNFFYIGLQEFFDERNAA